MTAGFLARMNGFNNTKCSGGMYSHAKHIWARHISLSFLPNCYSPLESALERRFFGTRTGICRYSLGHHWRNSNGRVFTRRHFFGEDGDNPISIPSTNVD